MSQINTNAILDASGGTTTTINGLTPTVSNMAGRNRIINGDMRIDQRNAGASVTLDTSGTYLVDRWAQNNGGGATITGQRSTTAPSGFTNSLLVTATTGGAPSSGQLRIVRQKIEGFNVADLGWGGASAQTVTVSFWVRSTATGTFACYVTNASYNRSQVQTFSISAADTWEYKTVSFVGDTSGTWGTGSGTGIEFGIDVGSGSDFNATAGVWNAALDTRTSGAVTLSTSTNANLYITGVQLEAGSVATPFEHRQYGQELALCQRYFQTTYSGVAVGTPATTLNQLNGWAIVTSTNWTQLVTFTCAMRTQPTVTIYNPNSGATGSARINGAVDAATAATNPTTLNTVVYSSASITAGHNVNYHYTSSAEL